MINSYVLEWQSQLAPTGVTHILKFRFHVNCKRQVQKISVFQQKARPNKIRASNAGISQFHHFFIHFDHIYLTATLSDAFKA